MAIVICPSNPYLSIDPILSVPGLRAALAEAAAPVVAVSPLIAGQAVKGPTAKIMAELGVSATAQAIAAHYRDLLDGLVIDTGDAAEAAEPRGADRGHVHPHARPGRPRTPRPRSPALRRADRRRSGRVARRHARCIGYDEMSDRSLWAVVPVKPFVAAKQRLSGILSRAERAELAR